MLGAASGAKIDWLTIWIGIPLSIVAALFLMLIFSDRFERWLEHLDYMKHHPGERKNRRGEK